MFDIEYLELFDSNSHLLYGPFQLCFSITFDKSKQAERSQNKMQYIPFPLKMYDKTYIRHDKMGHWNYSVSLC